MEASRDSLLGKPGPSPQGLEGLGRETEARAQAEPTCSAVRATAQSSTRKQAFPTGEPHRTPRLLSAGLGPWASPLLATAREVPRARWPEIPVGASFPPLNRSSFPWSCWTPWPCGRGGAGRPLPQAPGGSCGPQDLHSTDATHRRIGHQRRPGCSRETRGWGGRQAVCVHAPWAPVAGNVGSEASSVAVPGAGMPGGGSSLVPWRSSQCWGAPLWPWRPLGRVPWRLLGEDSCPDGRAALGHTRGGTWCRELCGPPSTSPGVCGPGPVALAFFQGPQHTSGSCRPCQGAGAWPRPFTPCLQFLGSCNDSV